ncbi:NUDIX domain-containing protein [Dysgonomonas sp. 25]|uniref:NUDIX hydrolase n=1 Tax=Dysgonomonas sp. 25 TaxID=2302933 RepID=UPI0013D64B21|nr:NUDIX domain-containing protein [Dysgonomonas sp. 25]NDV67612.1 NUDIX domain-containing protein [Dysgonomonas sp. 25]
MTDEIFPLVDEQGNIVGQATRAQCHSGSKLLHPVVHLHIFNNNGELFLQKRSPKKDIQPDKWDTSSAGHIDLGENPDTAVRREAYEELGITGIEPVFITSYILENEQERELSYCYYIVYDGVIQVDNDEVADGRFWTLTEIEEQVGKGVFTYNFEQDFFAFLKGWMNHTSEFGSI